MPAAQGVSKFVNRNNISHVGEKNARHSSSARGSSQTRQVNNNADLSQAERQRRAALARVPVPGTHGIHLKTEPEADMNELATVVANRSVSVASHYGQQPRNTFDDTDFEDTINSGLSAIEGEEHHVAFKTDYNSPSPELLKIVDAQHYTQQHGGHKIDGNDFPFGDVVPNNWQEIVQTERGLQAEFSRPSSVVDEFDNSRQIYQQDQVYLYNDKEDIECQSEDGEDDIGTRQLRIHDEQDHHDEQPLGPTPPRIRSNQMPPPPPPPPPPQLKLASTFTTNSVPTSKTSSYVEGSKDEVPPIQPVAKRARIELDYDPHVLKTMSYSDLDKEPFENNPRAPDNMPPVDEHGVPLTLHRRLGNLSRMKEEDVRAMFLTQKDQEWENTGTWFMKQFETQMRLLMGIRQERRMIALKFEMEAKRRQTLVATKMGDVEQELRYLKAGGRDLIDKRVSLPK